MMADEGGGGRGWNWHGRGPANGAGGAEGGTAVYPEVPTHLHQPHPTPLLLPRARPQPNLDGVVQAHHLLHGPARQEGGDAREVLRAPSRQTGASAWQRGQVAGGGPHTAGSTKRWWRPGRGAQHSLAAHEGVGRRHLPCALCLRALWCCRNLSAKTLRSSSVQGRTSQLASSCASGSLQQGGGQTAVARWRQRSGQQQRAGGQGGQAGKQLKHVGGAGLLGAGGRT